MFWVDNGTGVTAPPTIPPLQSPVRQYFTEGGQGLQPSIPGGDWFNMVTNELLAVLTVAGITPNKTDHSQVVKAIQAIAFSAYPIGSPIPYPLASPPPGYLLLNGQSFNTATYPKLAMVYPNGILPDMRGEFIRGYDSGRGVDPGRAILSLQSDQIKQHYHAFEASSDGGTTWPVSGLALDFNSSLTGSSPKNLLINVTRAKIGGAGGAWDGVNNTGVRIQPTGGNETRGRNLNFNYMVFAG